MMGVTKLPNGMFVNPKLRTMAIGAAAVLAFAFSAVGRGIHAPKSSSDSPSDDPSVPAGPDALRRIVQDHCVVNWLQHHDPAPCERIFLADPKTSDTGYAVLADAKGGAHYLLIPTETMAGVDSSELLDPETPNYFAEAWHARDLLGKFVGHEVPRAAIGLTVNTAQMRTQNQFHIHIECLRQDVFDSLRASAEKLTDVWAPVNVAGSTFQGLRIMAEGLDGSNPYALLATLKPDTVHHMGDYTLVVAGMLFKGGPGFVVLTGTGPTGELLMDSTCAVAGGGG
jgi:CDP-diacylglycerol pyrophosphatase